MSGPTPTTTAVVTPKVNKMDIGNAIINPMMKKYLNSMPTNSKFYLNTNLPEFTSKLEDLVKYCMDLRNENVYGNGGLSHSCGMVDDSLGYFLFYNFLDAMEEHKNPNPFAIFVLVYICSKSQSEIDRSTPELRSNGIDVASTRIALVKYIEEQENRTLFDEEGSLFYYDVWCKVSRWTPPLLPEYYKMYKMQEENVTVDNIKPIIRKCYDTLMTSSDSMEIIAAYVKLHTGFGILNMQRDELFGVNLDTACNILLDTIKTSGIMEQFPDLFNLRKTSGIMKQFPDLFNLRKNSRFTDVIIMLYPMTI